MNSKFDIVVQPESQVFWESWGKNHFNFTTLMCEFIDNSISNFLANPKLPNKNINITLNLNDERTIVEVTIEDKLVYSKFQTGGFPQKPDIKSWFSSLRSTFRCSRSLVLPPYLY